MSSVSRQALPLNGYFIVKAPVGQASTQFPQEIQLVSTSGSFIAGRISVLKPRPTRPRAGIGSILAHVLTHLAQSTHLFGSYTI